jgi:hypothetical protein
MLLFARSDIKRKSSSGSSGERRFIAGHFMGEINQKCRPWSTHVMRHTGKSQLLEEKETLRPFAGRLAAHRSALGYISTRKPGRRAGRSPAKKNFEDVAATAAGMEPSAANACSHALSDPKWTCVTDTVPSPTRSRSQAAMRQRMALNRWPTSPPPFLFRHRECLRHWRAKSPRAEHLRPLWCR